jgi:hypothetical protein
VRPNESGFVSVLLAQIALWTALPIWAADESSSASSGESMSSTSTVADPGLEQACPRVTEAMKEVATPLRQKAVWYRARRPPSASKRAHRYGG